MLSNSELNDLEDFAKNEYLYDSLNYFKELVLRAVQEIRTNRQSEPLLSNKQVPLGEITQDMLNKYYVYLETPSGNEIIYDISSSAVDHVVFVRTATGQRIRMSSTLALVTSVPK